MNLPSGNNLTRVSLRHLLVASIISSAAAQSHSSQVTTTAAKTLCACTKLAALYYKELLLPNLTKYKTEATDHWDLRWNLSLGCIFLPISAGEDSSAVKIREYSYDGEIIQLSRNFLIIRICIS